MWDLTQEASLPSGSFKNCLDFINIPIEAP